MGPFAVPASPSISAACDHVTFRAAGQFGQVGLGDGRQVEVQLTGQPGQVPEHIPQLKGQIGSRILAELAAMVAEDLFDLLRHLSGLPAQAQGGVDGVRTHSRVARCPGGLLLVCLKVHDEPGRG